MTDYPRLSGALSHQHPKLIAAAVEVRRRCQSATEMIGSLDDIHHDVDHRIVDRLVRLGETLQSVLILAEHGHASTSLAVARTALEHHLVDVLIMHSMRVQETEPFSDTTAAERYRAEVEADERCFEARVEGTNVIVSWQGVPVQVPKGEPAEWLSPYMVVVLLDSRPPLDRSSIDVLDEWDHPHDLTRSFAQINADRYHQWLKWESICKSLRRDRLLSDAEIGRYRALYSYLSRYTHGTFDELESVSHNDSSTVYAQELAVLLVLAIGLSEIESFDTYVDVRDRLINPLQPKLEVDVARLWREADHLWFPTRQPHQYDFIHGANTKYFNAQDDDEEAEVVDPNSLTAADLGYHADPLTRLRKLHGSSVEYTTGLGWSPPWPIADH